MKKGNQYFAEVKSDYTDPDTGNILIDAYPPNDPNDEKARVVAQVTPDGEVIPGTNPTCKKTDLYCTLVIEAIEEAKQAQVELKEKLVDDVIADLKKQFEAGDYTVLDELLKFIPTKNLIQSLPEEKWGNYTMSEYGRKKGS